MIQRFNFYDVYGYLIPGLAIVALVWLPSAIVTHTWQNEKLEWLAVAAAVAYVFGHVIQNLAANAVSAKVVRNADGKASYPSTAMLDPRDTNLDPDIKQRVEGNVLAWFGIDVAITQQADGPIGKRRTAAFSLCRPIVNARTAYAEQFEGFAAQFAKAVWVSFAAEPTQRGAT